MSSPVPPVRLSARLRRWSHTLAELVRVVVIGARRERLQQVAGSLTFTTVLALVPLLVIVFAVLTAFPVFNQMRESLRLVLLENLVPPNFSEVIFRALNSFAARARGLTIFGLIGLAATSMAMVLTIDHAINAMWRVRRPRPIGQRLLIYGVVLSVGPLLFAGSLALTSYAVSSFGLARRPPMALRVALDSMPLVASVFALAGLYRFMPNRRVAWRDAFIGALIAACAFDLAKLGFALFVTRFTVYSRLYGALAALPVFLVWIHLSWSIVLVGAMIAASGPLLRHGRRRQRRIAGITMVDALLILRALRPGVAPFAGLALDAIALHARLPAPEAERLLDWMERARLVQRFTPWRALRGPTGVRPWSGGEHWVMARAPAQVLLSDIFKALIFDTEALADLPAEAGFGMEVVLHQFEPTDRHTTLDDFFHRS